MSDFWSWWIIILTVLTLVGVTLLLFGNRSIDKNETEKTTGHIYDGIEEYDNPLPQWWFNLFLASIVFAVIYLVLYPGLGKFPGLLDWSSTKQWQASVEKAEAEFDARAAEYMELPAKELASVTEATKMGKRIFKTYCSTCHGNDARGAYAFPNLTDDDWLYGGDESSIQTSILKGRKGAMPAWKSILGQELDNMVDYVIKLGNEPVENHPAHEKYQTYCSACHGVDGKGKHMFGAPNLTDDIWLYGGDAGEVRLTLEQGRNGYMPAHENILDKERVHLVTAYIYSLNKGE